MKFILTTIISIFYLVANAQVISSKSLIFNPNQIQLDKYKNLEQEILSTISFNYKPLRNNWEDMPKTIPNNNQTSNQNNTIINLELEDAYQKVVDTRNRYGMTDDNNSRPTIIQEPVRPNFQPEIIIKPNGDVYKTHSNGIPNANPSYQTNIDMNGNIIITKTPW